jgi:hypothetical protein
LSRLVTGKFLFIVLAFSCWSRGSAMELAKRLPCVAAAFAFLGVMTLLAWPW